MLNMWIRGYIRLYFCVLANAFLILCVGHFQIISFFFQFDELGINVFS